MSPTTCVRGRHWQLHFSLAELQARTQGFPPKVLCSKVARLDPGFFGMLELLPSCGRRDVGLVRGSGLQASVGSGWRRPAMGARPPAFMKDLLIVLGNFPEDAKFPKHRLGRGDFWPEAKMRQFMKDVLLVLGYFLGVAKIPTKALGRGPLRLEAKMRH